MARFLFIFLVLVNVSCFTLAMANDKALSPEAKAVYIGRKFGKHRGKRVEPSPGPAMSPAEPHKHKEGMKSSHGPVMSPPEPHKHEKESIRGPAMSPLEPHKHKEKESIHGPAMSPTEPHDHEEHEQFEKEVSSSGEENVGIPREREIKVEHHHHRSVDKSVAGGGVILGGLVTTFMVALFCYIRATRRKHVEPCSPSANSSP